MISFQTVNVILVSPHTFIQYTFQILFNKYCHPNIVELHEL
jgi:hypothetical protein